MNQALPPSRPLSWVASPLRQARRNMGTATGCLLPPPMQCLPCVSWNNRPASPKTDQRTNGVSVHQMPTPLKTSAGLHLRWLSPRLRWFGLRVSMGCAWLPGCPRDICNGSPA